VLNGITQPEELRGDQHTHTLKALLLTEQPLAEHQQTASLICLSVDVSLLFFS